MNYYTLLCSLWLTVLLHQKSYAQKEILYLQQYKSFFIEAFDISSNQSENVIVGLRDLDSIYLHQYQSDFTLKRAFAIPFSSEENIALNTHLGAIASKIRCDLFFMNKDRSELEVFRFDIENETLVREIIDINLEQHRYLQSFVMENSFYFLTVKVNSSIVEVHQFEGDGTYQKLVFDLSGISFSQRTPTLFEVIAENARKSKFLNVAKVPTNSPQNLSFTRKQKKLFYEDGKVMLVFDNYREFSLVVILDVELQTFDIKKVYQNLQNSCSEDGVVQKNSTIYKGLHYQVSVCKQNLDLQITDLQSEELMMYFNLNKEFASGFGTTPYFLSEKVFKYHFETTELETTSDNTKFLKELLKQVGISVSENPDGILDITIGSYNTAYELNPKKGYRWTTQGLAINELTQLSTSDNNLYAGSWLNSYLSEYFFKSSYFKFFAIKKTYQSYEEDLPKPIFENIREFEKTLVYLSQAVMLFKRNERLYYGYFTNKNKEFFLMEF